MFTINGKYSTANVMIDNVEESCVGQITTMTNHIAFNNPIAIMPDTHSGKGSVIGFTMKLGDKIVPTTIGVDIGCGIDSHLSTVKISKMSLDKVDTIIRKSIPMGMNVHDSGIIHMKNNFPWKIINNTLHMFIMEYSKKFNCNILNPPTYDMKWFEYTCDKIGTSSRNVINSIGTLGGGNHFIEIGVDTNDNEWITIHSGSRNFGKRICDYWEGIAKKYIKHTKVVEKQKLIDEAKATLTDKELYEKIKEIKSKYNYTIDINGMEYLEGNDILGYLYDMIFAQMYAYINREYMIKSICNELNISINDSVKTVHNYIDFNDFIIRKGAIKSYLNNKMVIPFNMRDGILICDGKSNSEWNYSAPHGAGRVMSRSQAKKLIDLESFKTQMSNVYSTSVGIGTLDEAPDAYKDCKLIEDAIAPTATVINRIKPILNIKATESVENN